MARKFILFVKDGQITRRTLPPLQQRKRLYDWLFVARLQITSWRGTIGAMRFEGRWHVIGVGSPVVVKSFPVDAGQDVVELYLLTKESTRG